MNPEAVRAALQWAEERYTSCDVCALDCGVDRLGGELGRCGLGADARVYKEYLHLGEERELVPSHAVYLSGCNMRCAFCSDHGPVNHPQRHGEPWTPERLAERIALRRSQGARNVNFVGGVPDVNLLFILRTLELCPPDTRVVWNTNLWTHERAVKMLAEVVDVWLVDLKFGDDRCARRLSGTEGYLERMRRLLPLVSEQGEVIIRHLLMPGHLTCCTRPSLEWVARHLPDSTVNIMTGYQPYKLSGTRGPMGRALEPGERDVALSWARELKLTRCLWNGSPDLGSAQDPST